MKIFVDTADLNKIKEIASWCSIDGVTTNPSLVAKSGKEHHHLIKDICEFAKVPVSAEVVSTSIEKMYQEACVLGSIHPQVVVKLPLTKEGLVVTKRLSEETDTKTNVTLCFSALQALMAAKAGATIVSIFVGRLDDIGSSGIDVVSDVVQMFSYYQLKTQVLVASVRSISHILSAAQLGADISTIPPSLFPQLIQHPLTHQGLEKFLADFRSKVLNNTR